MELRRSTAAAGLVALLLLDIVLIVWALWPSSTAAAMRSATSVARSSGQPTTDGAAATAASTLPASAGAPVPLVRLVAGISSTTAWLVEGGECGQPARLHVTLDGGAEWATQSAPGSVTRIRPSDASSAFVVGGHADCVARVWYTGDRGGTWSAAQTATNAWGRSPDDSRLVLRPDGEPARPCLAGDVLDLVGLNRGDAVALCGDGAVRTTGDSGATWTTTTVRQGLLAISLTSSGEGAVVRLADNCPGLTVSALDRGRIGASECVGGVSYTPGEVAISVTNGAVWLVAGDGVYRADAVAEPFARVSTWPAP